jgi:hypothetical protein
MNPKWRQRLVDLIVALWPIMPNRARIWAFMNDGDLQDDADYYKNRR